MVSVVQRGPQSLEGKHTLVKASAEFSWTGSTSSSVVDFSHKQSFSQILHDSNKLKTENEVKIKVYGNARASKAK